MQWSCLAIQKSWANEVRKVNLWNVNLLKYNSVNIILSHCVKWYYSCAIQWKAVLQVFGPHIADSPMVSPYTGDTSSNATILLFSATIYISEAQDALIRSQNCCPSPIDWAVLGFLVFWSLPYNRNDTIICALRWSFPYSSKSTLRLERY